MVSRRCLGNLWLALAAALAACLPALQARSAAGSLAPSTVEFHPNVSNQVALGTPVPSEFLILLGHGTEDLQSCANLCVHYENSSSGPHLNRCLSFSRFKNATESASVGDCYGHVDPVWLPISGVVGAVPVLDSGRVFHPCTPAESSSFDCSHNGICRADGVCKCTQGWTGRRCETLDVLPVDRAKYGFLPTDAKGQNLSSWGGSVMSENGVWHMWAARMVNYW
jgi:hypothetical protein